MPADIAREPLNILKPFHWITFHKPTARDAAGQFTAGSSHVAFIDGHVELRPHTDTKEVFTPTLVKRHLTGDPNIR